MLRSRVCFCVLCAALGLALAFGLLVLGAQPASAESGPVSFINDVAPILKENCWACHDAKKRKGKLDMTTFESFRKGGSNEDPITAGKPDESLLYQLVTAKNAKRMPPKDSGEALAKEKIALIERWIKEGGKLDSSLTAKADLVRELRLRWKPPVPPASYKFPVNVTAIAFTPDNKKLVVGGYHELTVWDAATGKLEKRLYTRSERAYAMVFLPDGNLAVAGGRPGQEGNVRIYNLSLQKPVPSLGPVVLDGVNDKSVLLAELAESDDAVLCVGLSADGKKLASGGCDRLIRVWDLTPGYAKAKLEQTIENHADWVFGVTFATDGKHLLTASRDKTAKVWDLAAKESVMTFPEHQNNVYGVAVQPDGKVGFSVGEDEKVRAWNAKSGDAKQIRIFSGHTKPAFKVLYLPKQHWLLTCGADTTVRVWDGDKGTAVRVLNGHTDWVYALAVSPDGTLVASGGYNGEVKVWKIDDGKPVVAFNASPGLQQAAAAVNVPKK